MMSQILILLVSCTVSLALGCLVTCWTLSLNGNDPTAYTQWTPEQTSRRLQEIDGAVGAYSESQPSSPQALTSEQIEELRWKLLEPPLLDELNAILESRDKWWSRKLQEESKKLTSKYETQIKEIQQQKTLDQSNRNLVPQGAIVMANIGQTQQNQFTSTFNPNVLSRYKGSFDKAMEPIAPYITKKDRVLERQQAGLSLASQPPIIYFITPTVHRRTQMADLTRLGQTLLLDQYQQQMQGSGGLIYWIVVEDANQCTKRIRHFLLRLGIPFAHVAKKTPPNTKEKKLPPRGVEQRNYAMQVAQDQVGISPGVVYFGDDDNAYDVRLLDQLRTIPQGRVGILPVGYRGGGHYERCLVNPQTGRVQSIVEKTNTKRQYPMDMAGLAYHTSLLWPRRPTFSNTWNNGQQEDRFLQQLIDSVEDMEPLAYNCTHFFVWHLQTTQPDWALKVWPDPEYDSLRNMV